MKKNILISIVMPVFNAEKYLRTAVGDIIRQSYGDFELICVNDGSTDRSGEILDELDDKRIVVVHQCNQGAGFARNRGLELAKGEYVLFLDADDRFDNKMLERIVNRAEKMQTDILLFDAYIVNADTGVKLEYGRCVTRECLPEKIVFNYSDCPDYIFNISISVVWNKLYKKKFVEENRLLFQNTPYVNDMYFNHIALAEAERISYLNEKLISYKQNRKGALSDKRNRQQFPLCVCDVVDSIKDKLIEENKYDILKNSYLKSAFSQMLWTLETTRGDSFEILFEAIKHRAENNIEDIKQAISENDEYIWMRQDISMLGKLSAEEYVFYLLDKYKALNENYMQEVSVLTRKYVEITRKCVEIERSKKWRFEVRRLEHGNRIVIYGAGDVGTDFVEQLDENTNVEVVAWLDKNYRSIEKRGFHIENPETIVDKDFDYVIVAILDKGVQEEVLQFLLTKVDREKILLPF